MISSEWRITAGNLTGVALAAGDSIIFNGAVTTAVAAGTMTIPATWGTTLLTGGASLANGAYISGPAQNATPGTNIILDAECHMKATVSTATPAGSINYYLDLYDTVAAAWPPNGSGIFIGALNFTAVGTLELDTKLGV